MSEEAFLSLDGGKQVAQLERFLQGFHGWIAFCDGFQTRGGNCRDDYNGQIGVTVIFRAKQTLMAFHSSMIAAFVVIMEKKGL